MKNTEKKGMNQRNESKIKAAAAYIGGDKLVLLGAIIVVFALFTSINKNFLSIQNMINLLVAASLVGMVAVGHTGCIFRRYGCTPGGKWNTDRACHYSDAGSISGSWIVQCMDGQ